MGNGSNNTYGDCKVRLEIGKDGRDRKTKWLFVWKERKIKGKRVNGRAGY